MARLDREYITSSTLQGGVAPAEDNVHRRPREVGSQFGSGLARGGKLGGSLG